MDDSASMHQFRTHWNYVRSFWELSSENLKDAYSPRTQDFYSIIDDSFGNMPPSKRDDHINSDIEQSLRMAWATLLLLSRQLRMCDDAPELSRTIAAWASIQTYYAAYHSTQALIMATGQVRPNHHSKTQSQFSSLWISRREIVKPWSIGFGYHGAVNFIQPPQEISNISIFESENSLALVSMALRTTWNAEFKEALIKESKTAHKARSKKWNEDIRLGNIQKSQPPWGKARTKKLSTLDKARVGDSLGPASLLHYLARLRMRANYIGPDMFFDGPLDNSDCIHFVETLRDLAIAIIGVHERRIAFEIGASPVAAAKNRWQMSHESQWM